MDPNIAVVIILIRLWWYVIEQDGCLTQSIRTTRRGRQVIRPAARRLNMLPSISE